MVEEGEQEEEGKDDGEDGGSKTMAKAGRDMRLITTFLCLLGPKAS